MTALKAVTAPSARRRMATVAALAAAAGIALSGCSAGQHTQTSSQAAAINGNHADVGEISLRNVHIVYPEATSEHQKGGKAVLALSIINGSETVTDELTSVSTDLGPIKITGPAGGKFELKPQETVLVGPASVTAAAEGDDHHGTTTAAPTSTSVAPTPAPGGGDSSASNAAAVPASIEITGLAENITPGLTYTVTFNFKDAGTVQVNVPVDAATSERVENDKSGPAPEGAGGGH
ncbi:hypothetical protein [Nocardia caishijiensis]|uniref:Copper(I)-binding protein n=1 Tax=Nocardia caishijiensis TaxID=184756 RepID=A0ABQ6YEU9_9NOCA|nr:hypothetical protein [Nocardia caishijiensis]KAF0836508.1 hypothetical protein FNL39_1148 [Nocardia caishijiensis]